MTYIMNLEAATGEAARDTVRRWMGGIDGWAEVDNPAAQDGHTYIAHGQWHGSVEQILWRCRGIAIELDQQAVALRLIDREGGLDMGALVGQGAHLWGPFNPAYFYMPE